ncbi:MAG: hypothetical protein M3033_03650 [Acidobacteriota bacterium]|nr:hypothetical protein [Acidobacteriota bacterium]
MKSTKLFLTKTISFSLLFCLAALCFAATAHAQNSQEAQQKIKQRMQSKSQPQAAAQTAPVTGGQTTTAPQTNNTAAPTTNAVAPKKAGVYRIAIVLPKAQMTGSSPSDAAAAVQESLVAYLKGPAVEIVPIEAKIPVQIEAEVKEKQIDYVLYTSVTQKKGGGGLGGLMKVAVPIAMMASPIGMLGGMGGMIGAGVAGAAVQGVAGSIKAKDEITLEYKLVAPGGESTPRLANTLKGKAKKDGEDVLTPLIEQVATAIVTDITKKQ